MCTKKARPMPLRVGEICREGERGPQEELSLQPRLNAEKRCRCGRQRWQRRCQGSRFILGYGTREHWAVERSSPVAARAVRASWDEVCLLGAFALARRLRSHAIQTKFDLQYFCIWLKPIPVKNSHSQATLKIDCI